MLDSHAILKPAFVMPTLTHAMASPATTTATARTIHAMRMVTASSPTYVRMLRNVSKVNALRSIHATESIAATMILVPTMSVRTGPAPTQMLSAMLDLSVRMVTASIYVRGMLAMTPMLAQRTPVTLLMEVAPTKQWFAMTP